MSSSREQYTGRNLDRMAFRVRPELHFQPRKTCRVDELGDVQTLWQLALTSTLKGRKVPIKYRDKSGNTWAGRGAQPRWLTAAIKAGAKKDDFLVHKAARKVRKKRRSKK
jgi:hypothetical protein